MEEEGEEDGEGDDADEVSAKGQGQQAKSSTTGVVAGTPRKKARVTDASSAFASTPKEVVECNGMANSKSGGVVNIKIVF